MGRVLFVLKEGQVAFWKISRGSLVCGTLSGNRWNDFTSSYWDEWSEANQVGDSVDAILLSDKPNGFGTLPEWLQDRSEPSAWTVALLGKLANDAEFKDKGLVLSQRKAKFTLVSGDPVESYLLLSSCKFTLPKSEPAKPVAKPTPSSIVGDSYNDPEALKLSVGDELKGTIVKIFNAMKRNYVKVEGLKEQVCFKSHDTAKFTIGDNVVLMVTKVDVDAKTVLFTVVKHS
ncbi:MAG: hypothetical protein ACI4UY_01545 [Kiritimatiellia bacterium]